MSERKSTLIIQISTQVPLFYFIFEQVPLSSGFFDKTTQKPTKSIFLNSKIFLSQSLK